MSSPEYSPDDIKLYQAFDSYDFGSYDSDFSTNLTRLIDRLAPSSDSSRAAMTLKAKVLHFSRNVSPLSLDAYKAWKAGDPPPPLSFTSTAVPLSLAQATPSPTLHSHQPFSIVPDVAPPPPISFQELATLIMEGRADEVPVLEVEDKVLDVPDEVISRVSDAPKKPWEK